MRNLLISIVCLLALLIPCSIFHSYSQSSIDEYSSIIDKKLIPAIERGDWDTAEREFDYIADDWNSYRKLALYFLDNSDLNQVNGTLVQTYYYIKMHDDSNASGEAAYLNTSLRYLHESERTVMGNLF